MLPSMHMVLHLRLTNSKGDVHCSFIIGKSRLSPLKQLTIPRLELSAAVVATRLDRMVTKEIGIPVDKSILRTYSNCVLGYIANEDKRFHTFVANRAAAIYEVTSPPQWKHVGTKQNPADDASRGLTAEALLKNKRWGPWTRSVAKPTVFGSNGRRERPRDRESHKCSLPMPKQSRALVNSSDAFPNGIA